MNEGQSASQSASLSQLLSGCRVTFRRSASSSQSLHCRVSRESLKEGHFTEAVNINTDLNTASLIIINTTIHTRCTDNSQYNGASINTRIIHTQGYRLQLHNSLPQYWIRNTEHSHFLIWDCNTVLSYTIDFDVKKTGFTVYKDTVVIQVLGWEGCCLLQLISQSDYFSFSRELLRPFLHFISLSRLDIFFFSANNTWFRHII